MSTPNQNDSGIWVATYPADTIVNQIKTEDVYIEDVSRQGRHHFTALWDTGAQETGISNKVVEILGLTAIDRKTHKTAGDPFDSDHYCVNITLLSGYCIENHEVHQINTNGQDFDVLIGMDIISRGDFSISNYAGKTTFSVRFPSNGITDFKKKESLKQVMQPRHGQGKKKRK